MAATRAYAPAVFIGALSLGLLSYIAYVVFQAYPFSQDEYANLYQSYIFSLGKVWLDIDRKYDLLVEQYIILDKGHIFSKYPPGIALLLTPGTLLGAAWLVNPLIATATALVLFATLRKLVSPTAAWMAALLLVTNSYFLGYGGSYFAQPLSLLMCSLGFWGMDHYLREPRLRNLAAPGVAGGLYFLVRPLDAFCLLLAQSSLLLARPWRRHWKPLLVYGSIAACGILLLFTINYLLARCFCVATYTIWNDEFRVVDHRTKSFMENVASIFSEQMYNYGHYSYTNLVYFFVPVVGAPFLMLAGAGGFLRENPLRRAGLALIVLLVVLYNFHGSLGWPQYGTRYWYPMLAPFTIFAGYALDRALRRFPLRHVRLALAAALAWQLLSLHGDLQVYARRFELVNALKADIEKACPEQSVVALIRPAEKPPGWPDFVGTGALGRNFLFKGPRYYVEYPRHAMRAAQALPGYTPCPYPLRFPDAR